MHSIGPFCIRYFLEIPPAFYSLGEVMGIGTAALRTYMNIMIKLEIEGGNVHIWDRKRSLVIVQFYDYSSPLPIVGQDVHHWLVALHRGLNRID